MIMIIPAKKSHTRTAARGILFLFLSLLILNSCQKSRFTTLVRKDLFTIPLGVMSDELDYYYEDSLFLPGKSDLFMSDGLFYISSTNMGKIMGFNSYGDLLFLLIDEAKNPSSEISAADRVDKNSNKQYASWPFKEVGQVALSNETLLVEDSVSQEKSIYDKELESLCSKVILRFDLEGNYIDFLGKEGIGGSPFPYISDILVRENGEFLVYCQVSLGQQVFWYSPEGKLLFHIIINNDTLPLLKEGYWSSLVKLSYHPTEYKLYLLVDFYPEDLAEIPKGVERKIFTLTLADQKYDDGISIPDMIKKSDGAEVHYIYDLLGTTSEGVHILLSKTGQRDNSLLAINEEGKTLINRSLQVFDSPEIFTSYFLSHEGMLLALTYLQDGAPVSWWRSDDLLKRE